MSLPLPRRIAQAALLLGAAAAPLIGAGAAHAAALPTQGLVGLSNLDGAALGDTVGNASHQGAVFTADAGTDAMKATLPTADRIVGTTGRTALPTAGDAAGRIAGESTESAGAALPSSEMLPTTSLVPNAGALPPTGVGGLSTDQLPLRGLPTV
jgi:hypothetical protein